MFRKLAAFVVALLILPGLAAAHGPTRQKASETITIDAAPDKVWAVIANFGDMSWHPRIAMADAPNGNEKGSVRTLGFTTGGMMEEELSKYDAEKMTYSTFIGHVNVDLLPLMLAPKARRMLAFVVLVASIAVVAIMLFYGSEQWWVAFERGWKSDTVWGVPLWIPYLSIPVGFGLLLLQLVADLVALLLDYDMPFGQEDR